MKEYSGRILLRLGHELHNQVADWAKSCNTSINEFIIQSINEKIGREMIMRMSFSRVVLGELKVKEVREAVIVTQHPWYMNLFQKYKIYFFNKKLGSVTPMKYLLFYETNLQEEDGSKNDNPKQIVYWGKVKEIIYGISTDDFMYIPELKVLTEDETVWDVIQPWNETNVVICEEAGAFNRPIPLKNRFEAKYLVNKTTTLTQLRNAEFIDDLY